MPLAAHVRAHVENLLKFIQSDLSGFRILLKGLTVVRKDMLYRREKKFVLLSSKQKLMMRWQIYLPMILPLKFKRRWTIPVR